MSFGSSMRFAIDSKHGKPAIFWDQGKQPKKPRKFGYKTRELRHPLRNETDEADEEVITYRHDNHKQPTQPLKEKTDQPKMQKPPRPSKDFIRKNRERAGGKKKEKEEENEKTAHPMANTVTLTQEQLNAILSSVGKMSSGKENALRISIDKETNEIQIANAAKDKEKGEDGRSDEGKDGQTEDKDEGDGDILSLLTESKTNEGTDDTSLEKSKKEKSKEKKESKSKERSENDSEKDTNNSAKDSSEKPSKSVRLDLSDTKDGGKSSDEGKYESPRVALKHMTVAEKKRLQWARERAELSQNYDPWGRPGAGAPLRDNGGHILADYNSRKDDIRKSVDEEKQDIKESQPPVKKQESPRSKAAVGGFVIDEDICNHSKEDEKKKWLEELEKQREELRKRKQRPKDSSGPDDTWADRFSKYKPAAVPQQETRSKAAENKPSQADAASSNTAAHPQQHAAIRSSFAIGAANPDDKMFIKTKEDEKRQWLLDLEKQMEEDRMRKMKAKDRERAESDTWADRFGHDHPGNTRDQTGHISTRDQPGHQTGRLDVPPISLPQDSPGRTTSAPEQNTAREDGEFTYLQGQHVPLDPLTRQELENKKKRFVEHQDALRMQIEEKERKKREAKERKMREEMEEEAKLRKERDALQNQFTSEQQRTRQKEEARQKRIDELKAAMDEAQEKAAQEKLIRRMQHLKQGGHDVSHLQAHLDAMTPHVHKTEPTHVPGLNLHSSRDSAPSLPAISSRTVDIPNPTLQTHHDPYVENRVLTPKDELVNGEFKPRRETSEVEIEYKQSKKPAKKVRVVSAPKDAKKDFRKDRQKEQVENVKNGKKIKWNYQNPKSKRPVKQSERDPFYERKRQQSEERRAKRERELLAAVELNKPIIPEGRRSRDVSPSKDGHSPRSDKGRHGRSTSNERQHSRRVSPSPHRSKDRHRSPAHNRSFSPPPSHRTNEHFDRSPPVPALKHRREQAQVLKVNDDGYSNTYDTDQYNYSNYRPPTGPKKPHGHYDDVNPIDLNSSEFVPFTRTTEILDPSRAVEPIHLSRENSHVKRGRKAYRDNHNPANYGNHMDAYRDGLDRSNDPIMNPDLVKGHPTARQDMILKQLSTLKQSLMQRQRELETCMSPVDLDQ